MSIRFWKWVVVVLLAAAVVIALRHSLRSQDGPGLGQRPPADAELHLTEAGPV